MNPHSAIKAIKLKLTKGKPKLSKEKQKNKLVQTRVTEADYAELIQIAKETGVNYVSSIFRVALKNFIISHRS